jgi:hypothetical protein
MKKYIFTEEQIKKVIDGTMSEQSEGSIGNSEYKWRGGYKPKMEKGDIPLRQQLLFIIENIDGRHTEDIVTREQMTEVLKQTIEKFVNPDDFIPYKEWNKIYYSITNDMYA